MRKVSALFLTVIMLCIQAILPNLAMAETTNTDIIISNYSISENYVYEGKEFDLTVTFKNNSGVILNDVYMIIVQNNSFYVPGGSSFISVGTGIGINAENSKTVKIKCSGTGNELKIRFKYKKNGSETEYETEQSIYINTVGQGSSSSGDTSTPSTNKYKPQLDVVGNIDMPVLKAGSKTTLVLPVKNSSSFTAKNIVTTLDIVGGGKDSESTKLPFIPDKINFSEKIDQIAANETKNINFAFKVDPKAEGIYSIRLKFDYQNQYNDRYNENEVSQTIYVKVENNNAAPKVNAAEVSLTPSVITPGGSATAVITLKNNGTMAAKDINISLKDLNSQGFTLSSGVNQKYVSRIGGRGKTTVEYELATSKGITAGSHELTVKIDYKDDLGNTYSQENKVFIPVGKGNSEKPNMEISNISTPRDGIEINKDFNISFDLTNKGDGTARNILATLSSSTDKIIYKSQNPVMLNSIEKGKMQKLNFVLSATQDISTNNHPVLIKIEYQDADGNKHTAEQYVGVYAENGDSKSKPKIIIDSYSFEPGVVKAAENFILRFSCLNTNKTMTVGNLKITLSSDIFTPANSSNSFYVDEIGSGCSIEKEIEFFVKPDAVPGSYKIKVDFSGEDNKGMEIVSTEEITVPVLQNPKLVTGDISYPPEAFVGQPVPVFLDFYNMGKCTLYNLMIKLEGDFDGKSQNYFVGNFEPGRSDSFDGNVTPKAAGGVTGNIVFSFEDANGKPMEIKKEFNINVMEMMPQMPPEGMPPEGMPQEGQHEKPFNKLLLIPIGVGVIAVVITIIVIVKKNKVKKGMTLDE